MTNRCIEIMKLADMTYQFRESHPQISWNLVTESLKAQREFAKVDVLLTNEESQDMQVYITNYIVDSLMHELESKHR